MFSIVVKERSVKDILALSFLQILVIEYERMADSWKGNCPQCSRPFTKHGTYGRKTPGYIPGLYIRRVRCKHCKVTHALLPCFLLPYARHLDVNIEAAIRELGYESQTVEQLAEVLNVEPSTIGRWRRRFKTMTGHLIQGLSQKLVDAPLFVSDWIGRFEVGHSREVIIFDLIRKLKMIAHPDFPYCDLALLNIILPFWPTVI